MFNGIIRLAFRATAIRRLRQYFRARHDLSVALIVGTLSAAAFINVGAVLVLVGRRYLHGYPEWSQPGWRIVRSFLFGTAAGLGLTALMGHIVLPLFLGLSSAPSMLPEPTCVVIASSAGMAFCCWRTTDESVHSGE